MLEFRPANYNDIPIIRDLARTIWYSHYTSILSNEQIEYMLHLMYSEKTISDELHNKVRWYLLVNDLIPIGYLSFFKDEGKNAVKLSKLYLLTIHHGKGYGQQALQFVKDQANHIGVEFVYLTVNKNNVKAIAAYQRAGFVIAYEQVVDIGNGFVMDDYVMEYRFR